MKIMGSFKTHQKKPKITKCNQKIDKIIPQYLFPSFTEQKPKMIQQ